MKGITNIQAWSETLKKASKNLNDLVVEAFKEATASKDVDFTVYLEKDIIYSIGCGRYFASFYSHKLFYMDGEISLYSMSFENKVRCIASWKSIEKFKSEIANHFK